MNTSASSIFRLAVLLMTDLNSHALTFQISEGNIFHSSSGNLLMLLNLLNFFLDAPRPLFCNKLIEADPGETVILQCLANADPPINHYVWKHDDQRLNISIESYTLFNITVNHFFFISTT